MWSSVVNFILTAASMVPFGPPPMPSVSDFHLSSACLRPAERREWGTLTKDERAEWIGAIKVEPSLLPCEICAHLDGDTVLGRDAPQRLGFRIPISGQSTQL